MLGALAGHLAGNFGVSEPVLSTILRPSLMFLPHFFSPFVPL